MVLLLIKSKSLVCCPSLRPWPYFVLLSRLMQMTVGFLYGAGAETRIFCDRHLRRISENVVTRQKNQSQLCIPRKPRKIGVWVSGAEIQASAVDTRTAVWVSTAEKFFKIVLGETRNFARKFRGVSAPALYKNPVVMQMLPYSSLRL